MATAELLASGWTTAGPVVPFSQPLDSPIDVRQRIRVASEAGFVGFGLAHADLLAARDTIGYRTLKQLLDDHGIVHVEVETLGDWFAGDERRATSDRVRRDLLEAAEALSARHIKAEGDQVDTGWPVERMVDDFHELCAQAHDVGSRIAFEPMPFGNVRTPRDALGLVEAADHPAAGMCIDAWHVDRGKVSSAELAALPAAAITTVELNDGDAERVGTPLEDTLHRRKLCGTGSFDLTGFVTAIRSTGYDGPWGVEILSDELRARDIEESIPDVYATTMATLAPA
ncbi:sugar phosphate isomerase/epimerase [soil metagenome]